MTVIWRLGACTVSQVQEALKAEGLIEEIRAEADMPAWRKGDDGEAGGEAEILRSELPGMGGDAVRAWSRASTQSSHGGGDPAATSGPARDQPARTLCLCDREGQCRARSG